MQRVELINNEQIIISRKEQGWLSGSTDDNHFQVDGTLT